jgi:hypothetical protein
VFFFLILSWQGLSGRRRLTILLPLKLHPIRNGKTLLVRVHGIRECEDVSKEALKNKTKVHVGKVFEICVEKGSELPLGDPMRKFKGRTVFQGNNVKDEAALLCHVRRVRQLSR